MRRNLSLSEQICSAATAAHNTPTGVAPDDPFHKTRWPLAIFGIRLAHRHTRKERILQLTLTHPDFSALEIAKISVRN